MIKYPYSPTDQVLCTCCGAWLDNKPGSNVSLHRDVGAFYPQDEGYGECTDCGGDPSTELTADSSDDTVRRVLGSSTCRFYDSRIPRVAESLSDKNRAKYAAMPLIKQIHFVDKLIEVGKLT